MTCDTFPDESDREVNLQARFSKYLIGRCCVVEEMRCSFKQFGKIQSFVNVYVQTKVSCLIQRGTLNCVFSINIITKMNLESI